MLSQFGVFGVALVHQLILCERAKVLAEAIAYELEVARDVVDNGAEAGQTGGDHVLLVLQDQLDRVLLELGEERLARVLEKRHDELQSLGHVADDLEVPGSPTTEAEVRLQGHGVRHQQSGPDLGKQIQRPHAGHESLRGASAFASFSVLSLRRRS